MTMTRDEWLAKLEQERFSYRDTTPLKVEVREVIRWQTKPCKKTHVSEQRDKLMFNAGRYAAGATDVTAVEAHWELMKQIEKGN